MRILLAEDERELASALEVIFKHNNYSIDVVYDGVEAVEYAESYQYDAIILDIMMPRRNGLEALKMIREMHITTPVLLLTAKSQISDKVAGLDAGADDYLAKPFSTPELLARIRALTRRGNEATTNNELTVGNTTLNLVTFKVRTPLGEVALINKEFQLLLELMKKPGLVHSVYQLLDKIWGLDSDVYDDVVWVNVSNLRKKLKTLGSNIAIKTKRNFGYYVEVAND